MRSVHIDPSHYHELYVITNSWHMDRTRAIFDTVFSLCQYDTFLSGCYLSLFLPDRVRSVLYPSAYSLQYIPVEHGMNDNTMLSSRISREAKSLDSFIHSTKKEWNTFEQMHQWIFTQHAAYATKRFDMKQQVLSPEVLKTY